MRIKELVEIILEYPESSVALLELGEALERTQQSATLPPPAVSEYYVFSVKSVFF